MKIVNEILKLREEVAQLKTLIEQLRLELAQKQFTVVVNPAPQPDPITPPLYPSTPLYPGKPDIFCGTAEVRLNDEQTMILRREGSSESIGPEGAAKGVSIS